MRNVFRRHLISASVLAVSAVLATPVFAQTAAPAPAAAAEDTIVVTGSLLRRKESDNALPITTITADDLDKRGVNTVQDAIQTLAANGGGTLPNSFSANGAFAAGASAASLRGLTTSSTLVLFDGLRAAYYPLADDGSRNFVDLNTIPDAIVERVEVLKDGASSSYGADAVAGVINIITKKQFTGVLARAEAGITGRGDNGQKRLEITAGYGDLAEQGFNIYGNVHYYKSDILYNRDRGAPFNSSDLSRICAPGQQGTIACDFNNVANGIQADGTFLGISTATLINYARPGNATTLAAIAGSRYQQLTNPAGGCGPLTAVTLTAAQQTNTGGNGGAIAPSVVCQEDIVNRYNVISPEIERYGATLRGTVKLGDDIEAYAMFNYERSKVAYSGLQAIYRTTTSPGPTGQRYTTSSNQTGVNGLFGRVIALPVFICPRGTTVACTAANGALNPNNPFAAQGQAALILGRLGDIQESNETISQAYRGAAGIGGTFGEGWGFNVEATGMKVNLDRTLGGRIFVQNFLDAVNDGSYNWVNPNLNSQAVRDFIAPTIRNRATSELYQVQGSVTKDLFELPGGPVQVAVGASYRFEKVDAPTLNPGVAGQPTQQYFRVNAFSATGSRNVKSAYFEVGAPIIPELEVNLSGRYDKYSSGQDNFSPKVSARLQPIPQVTFRGAYSTGFRIPSFAEANAGPTTGFVTISPPASFRALYPAGAAYTGSYGLGLTSAGNPNLKPEKSRNITAGIVVEPVPWLSLAVDYYNIKKTDVIASADYTIALNAYYANAPIPTGFTVIPDQPDVNNPTLRPRAGFVVSSYINGPSQNTSGLDFTASARIPITDSIRLISSLQATYVINYDQTFINPDGTTSIQRYAGTLGNFQITSGSGTPRWRGSWQNTLDFGKASLTATTYYTGGYSTTAEDTSGSDTAFKCGVNDPNGVDANTHTYRNGVPVSCFVEKFINVDLNLTYDVNDNFSVYANILNVFDTEPPYDGTTYGGYQYNPAWANSGIIGRAFRAGAKVKF